MTTVLLRLPEPQAAAVAAQLAGIGARVSIDRAGAAETVLEGVDLLVVQATRRILTPGLVATADAAGTRIVPVGRDTGARRLAISLGLGEPLAAELSARRLAERILRWRPEPQNAAAAAAPTIIAVWGAHGAPGRTTIAVELALELSRRHGHTVLVDADAHAPSVAIALGLSDEGPGLPAACRQAELGGLDAAELQRISVPMDVSGADVDVLVGINRPGRWPELSATRMTGALAACRSWAPITVVDIAASLEADEEITSDLIDGPRRNAATLATLAVADRVIAVLAADPVGVSRFIRSVGALRDAAPTAEIMVVVNRMRASAIGVDHRGQLRRTLERYAGITRVWFLPDDPRAMDAARLRARPAGDAAPRSALGAAVRSLTDDVLPLPARDTPRGALPHRRARSSRRAVL